MKPPSDFSPSVLAAPFGRCCDPHASLSAPWPKKRGRNVEETPQDHVTMPGVFSKLESHLSLIALDASLQTWAEGHSPTCVLFGATGYEFAPVRCGLSQWVVATIPCTSCLTYQSCKFRLLLLDLGSQLLNALLPRSVSCTVEKRYCANLSTFSPGNSSCCIALFCK